MKKRTIKIERDKNELSYICTECGNFYETMDVMDKHLVAKHSLPVYVNVSRSIN